MAGSEYRDFILNTARLANYKFDFNFTDSNIPIYRDKLSTVDIINQACNYCDLKDLILENPTTFILNGEMLVKAINRHRRRGRL